MVSSMRQTIDSTKYYLQTIIPSLTMSVFIGFAFFMGSMIVLSIIPLYIENKSVEKTKFILTTVRINNYMLYMNQLIKKRDLVRLTSSSSSNTTETLDQAQMTMNSSIQYALQQQLIAGNNREKFNIYILNIISYTNNPNNISILLDFLIVYTRECITCDKSRQLIIFNQLCSNNKLSTSIRVLIQYANLSYVISDPIIFYTTYIPIENITILTQIISISQFNNIINNMETNQSMQMSNKFLANNYTLTITTTKSNYFATLDEVRTQTSADQNDGPVSLAGSITMYSDLAQIIKQQIQLSNNSNTVNITINNIILQFWYLNSTVHVIVNFLINFSTSCNNQCINQRNTQIINQLSSLINTQIHIQPANLTDGQVQILKNGIYILYDYSLTTQVISNFTGTVIYAMPPTLTIIY